MAIMGFIGVVLKPTEFIAGGFKVATRAQERNEERALRMGETEEGRWQPWHLPLLGRIWES